jgi:hypothetical protein
MAMTIIAMSDMFCMNIHLSRPDKWIITAFGADSFREY